MILQDQHFMLPFLWKASNRKGKEELKSEINQIYILRKKVLYKNTYADQILVEITDNTLVISKFYLSKYIVSCINKNLLKRM